MLQISWRTAIIQQYSNIFQDHGIIHLQLCLSCVRSCPWYNKCGLFGAKSGKKCKKGYKNDGCTCQQPLHVTLRAHTDVVPELFSRGRSFFNLWKVPRVRSSQKSSVLVYGQHQRLPWTIWFDLSQTVLLPKEVEVGIAVDIKKYKAVCHEKSCSFGISVNFGCFRSLEDISQGKRALFLVVLKFHTQK